MSARTSGMMPEAEHLVYMPPPATRRCVGWGSCWWGSLRRAIAARMLAGTSSRRDFLRASLGAGL
eukprot:119110-Alexandrium_andersonii.AAC.1